MFFRSSSMPAYSFVSWKTWLRLCLVIGTLLFAGGYYSWYKLFREVPQVFATEEEAFKYGSIGGEDSQGIPYWIWVVLPRIFPEYLPGSESSPKPGGYAALGVAWEEGHETPIGFSIKTIGIPRIAINCALCHTGTYRLRPEDIPTAVPTAPAQKFDAQAYQRFLFNCASDPKFNADTILQQISYSIKLSCDDKLLYRYLLIPATKKALLQQKKQYSWMETRPDWLCGRIDPFNPVKFSILNIDPKGDSTIGNSDMEPLWNLGMHENFALHWDGLNTSLQEVVLSGAIGDGATKKSLPVKRLKVLETWLKTVKPPRYPYDEAINSELANKGEAIFKRLCFDCHGFGGKKTGTVISLGEIGTDPNRLQMWTQQAVDNYNKFADGYEWSFKAFQKTDGYVSVALDGIWLRAPYLHNGSVPTLEDLLKPASDRPKTFYRGYDVYSRDQMGFIHQGDQAKKHGALVDTSVPGNSNSGHEGEIYGTNLSPEEKQALVEYLKKL